jgi:hypothetical protein
MVQNRERQPHNQLRLFVGYGLQLALALVGGACLDLPECTHDPRHDTHTAIENTTNIQLQTCASWRHVNQPETLPILLN